MSRKFKLILIVHHDERSAQLIQGALKKRRLASAVITKPERLAPMVSYFQADYVVLDVVPGSDLEIAARDFLATPSERLRFADLRERPYTSIEHLSRSIELELE